MLAWAFRPDAVQAAQQLREQEATDLNFIRLDMVRIDSPTFREHVSALTTDKADYSTFLTFVLPPRVEVGWKKLSGLAYRFDVSETAVLNSGGKIINVQWDFDYRDVFTSTQGFSFIRTAKKEPALQVDYTFPAVGRYHIACEVLDQKTIGEHGLLLNIVTGGGKTAVIAAIIAWLRISHGVRKCLLLCPNLIVRDRLEEDFENGRVFKDRDLLPDWSTARPQDFDLTTLGGGKSSGWASLLGASIVMLVGC